MDDFDPDTHIARLMARIGPRWDAARTESNLAAILEQLKGPKRRQRAWQALLAATRLRFHRAAR